MGDLSRRTAPRQSAKPAVRAGIELSEAGSIKLVRQEMSFTTLYGQHRERDAAHWASGRSLWRCETPGAGLAGQAELAALAGLRARWRSAMATVSRSAA